MTVEQLAHFEAIFAETFAQSDAGDPAHDLLHIRRVVAAAKRISVAEGGRIEIVVPAAWLHDFVVIPKNDPRRSQASCISADAAITFLRTINYPEEFFSGISHAIAAHSYSAGIVPESLEAKIVQDADRLDALGAIGIARCFITAGLMRRTLYSDTDPFCTQRHANDQMFTVDHFYKKLFHVADTLQTATGRQEGERRVHFMKTYLSELGYEIDLKHTLASNINKEEADCGISSL